MKKKLKFEAVNICFIQILLPYLLNACAPHSELPSYIGAMLSTVIIMHLSVTLFCAISVADVGKVFMTFWESISWFHREMPEHTISLQAIKKKYLFANLCSESCQETTGSKKDISL